MKVLKDFSGLGKAVQVVRTEKPSMPEPVADAGQEVLDYFGVGSDDAVEEPLDVEEIREEIQSTIDEIVGERIAAECRAKDAEKGADRLRNRISDLMKEIDRLKGDNARMKGELAKLAAKECPHEDVVQDKAPVKVVRKEGILDVPDGFIEAFPGEIREMVIASLREYEKNISGQGYDRRDAVIKSVLDGNRPSGELERREGEIRQILKDAGYFNNPAPLAKLGIKLIDGRKHWKLEYAGIRMTLAKTPSDHCSNSNSAADIARRCL